MVCPSRHHSCQICRRATSTLPQPTRGNAGSFSYQGRASLHLTESAPEWFGHFERPVLNQQQVLLFFRDDYLPDSWFRQDHLPSCTTVQLFRGYTQFSCWDRAAADKAKEVATRAQKLMEEAVIAPGEIRDATKHAEVAVQGKAKAMGRKGNRARPAAVVSIENTILKNTFPVHLFDSLFLIGDPFEVFFRSA